MNRFNHIMKWVQRHALTVPTFGHLVMLACAIASFENIHLFFKSLHGSELVATGLGVAIGAALVMAAALLSGMEWDWHNRRLQLIALVTLALALLSGGIQGAAYHQHGLHWMAAYVVGLALPVVGELGIALAVSAYQQEQKQRRAAMADELIEQRINESIDQAMADIDVSSAKRHVERAAEKIVKSKMDALLAARLRTESVATNGNSRQTTKSIAEFLPEANAERQRLIAERRTAILQLFAAYGEMSGSELRTRLAEDVGIDASDRTLRGDLGELVQAGELVKVRRGRWDVARPIVEELPVLEMPALNGA